MALQLASKFILTFKIKEQNIILILHNNNVMGLFAKSIILILPINMQQVYQTEK